MDHHLTIVWQPAFTVKLACVDFCNIYIPSFASLNHFYKVWSHRLLITKVQGWILSFTEGGSNGNYKQAAIPITLHVCGMVKLAGDSIDENIRLHDPVFNLQMGQPLHVSQ